MEPPKVAGALRRAAAKQMKELAFCIEQAIA